MGKRLCCFLVIAAVCLLFYSVNAQTSLTVTFTHGGEDCPAGGICSELIIGYSLAMPPDTNRYLEECPDTPTQQDVANFTWWTNSFRTSVTPKDPGTLDSLVITGLSYDTDVWIGAQATDDAGNKSALVVRHARTEAPPDTVPPKPVDVMFFR